MSAKLRIGFLLDSVFLPAWVLNILHRIISSDYAELTLVVLNQLPIKKTAPLLTFWQRRNRWFYDFFNAIDEKLFLRGVNASIQKDASNVFLDVPTLKVHPVGKYDDQHFSSCDVEQIKSYQLDILVKMGFGTLCGDVLSAAKYGLWSYRWGDHCKIEDGLTGFWETVERWPETGVALEQREASTNRILFESWFFTYPYSPARSRNYILWASSSFLPRQIEKLYRLGEAGFFQKHDSRTNKAPSLLRSNDIPSNFSVFWIMMKLAARNLLEVYRRTFFRDQWGLLFSRNPNFEKDILAYENLFPPLDRFWADPHMIYQKPNYYIFIEEYPYSTKRGHISVIEMDSKGNYKLPVPVLKKDWHLSFPYVFEWRGIYYMIPESSENRTIDLYECARFPDQWQHKITLMKDITAVDTTVLYRDGKWWLFSAMAEQEAAAPQVELFLYYSDELFTNRWCSHPMNPIVSDVKKARGAGGVFVKDGKLFRPSQYCSDVYGYGFDLNEIVTLSETEYCERVTTSIRPDHREKFIAIHTYANQGNLTVIDALVRLPKWAKAV